MSWVERQEFKENRRLNVLLICAMAAMTALTGWTVIADWRQIVAELTLNWNGLFAVSKLLQPVMFLGLTILHFKLGLNTRG